MVWCFFGIIKHRSSKRKWTVPRPADKKNKSLSQNIKGLHGFAPDFIGSKAVFQVNALKIVKVDVLSNQFFNLSASRIPSAVQAFGFERTKEVFHGRVVVRTSGTGHGRPKVVFFA